MEPDDADYRRNVRNMSVVLAAIVITAFGAILIPPYLFPPRTQYVLNASETSPSGFSLHLTLNSTSVSPSGSVLVTGWINSTSNTVVDINASSNWGLPPGRLWGNLCTNGWPIGIGIMKGHYSSQNYTSGALLPIQRPLTSCPAQSGTPQDFVFKPHSSMALVTLGIYPKIWNLRSSYAFREYGGGQLPSGVYTALLADEWGDVLPIIFRVA